MAKSIIVGTAGHIDHGKTALVKALTGTDTDRLPEEKERGITIDIGFAHVTLDDMHVSFVDVPGHERFIKNMLAGIGGIDLLLLIVAADESVMPQTREHFEICKLLGIDSGGVVITKKDLVDAETLEIVKAEIDQLVAKSFLENAPIAAVSSKTGEGIDELKSILTSRASMIEERSTHGIFRLPIDRVFVLRGHGTVVTGTLLSGEIPKDSLTEILPSHRKVRVRSVHAHNQSVERASAGQRTALNLIGVEKQELQRGDALTAPDVFEATSLLDVRLELLPQARPLRHNETVRFHHLTNDLLARVTLMQRDILEPGENSFAQLRLQRPVFAFYNDRFILRRHSPLQTIGGGIIVDHMPVRRVGPGDTRARERMETLLNSSAEIRMRMAVAEKGFAGADERFLKAKLAMTAEQIAKLNHDEVVILKSKPMLAILRATEEEISNKMKDAVKKFHSENPLLPGIAKEELRTRFFPFAPPEVFDLILLRTVQRKMLEIHRDAVSVYGRKLSLTEEENIQVKQTEDALRNAGLQGTLDPIREQTKISEEKLKTWLHLLVRMGKAIKIADDYFLHSSVWEDLKQRIRGLKPSQTRLSVPDFKTLFGITRKYAIPLLEQLDREGVTRRTGNERIIT